jgi:hypothetical protein
VPNCAEKSITRRRKRARRHDLSGDHGSRWTQAKKKMSGSSIAFGLHVDAITGRGRRHVLKDVAHS